MENNLFNLIITDVSACNRINIAEKTTAKRYNRERTAIAIKTEGSTVYIHNNKEYLSDKNHICILPKNSSYSYFCEKKGLCLMIELETIDNGILPFMSIKINNSDEIIKEFYKIEHSLNFKTSGSRFSAIKGIYSILEKLSDQLNQEYISPKTNEILAPAIKYIEETLHLSAPTNDFLASLCNISCVYFRKIFTKKFNMPPSKYITMLKIQRAKGLIIGDTVSMADISSSCGFSSIYHFSKVFKDITGLTPTQFKRENNHPRA